MNDQDHPAFLTARAAVELLIGLGPESVRADILAESGHDLNTSPLAGELITAIELDDGMFVGPSETSGNHHVTMRMRCNGHSVEAYCMVTSDDRGVHLVQAYIYVDGKYAVHRNVSVGRDARLTPWGMPD